MEYEHRIAGSEDGQPSDSGMSYEAPPGCAIALSTARREVCMESRFVLTAVGIAAEAVHQNRRWWLVVAQSDLAAAAAELRSYREENLAPSSPPTARAAVHRGGPEAVWVYAGIILLFAIWSTRETIGWSLMAAGQMHAGSVMAGQWWRTITALTLHLDAGHLVANLVFGTVFGLLTGRILGGGVAWLSIVIAGSLGNLMNAAAQGPLHTSIGASTAVFAALGVIVADALRARAPAGEKRLRRWSPLIGGVLLLAFTGVGGERTDVGAHFAGFLAGLAIGSVLCRLPSRWLAKRGVQWSAGAATIGALLLAWTLAIRYAN